MSDFWSSLSKWFDEKANSPLYWTYFAFLVVWNWKFFQIIFLEDASLFVHPRVEYLSAFNLSTTNSEWLNWLLTTFWHILPPAILTYAAIKWLPLIHEWAFDIYTDSLFKRKTLFQRKKAEYEEEIARLTKKEVVAKQESVRQKQVLEKTKTQEEKWEEEFEQIKRQDLLQSFQKLVGVLYKRGGVMYGTQVEDYLPNASATMAFSGTYDLISTEKRESGAALVQLTDKGKYFSRLLANKGIIAQ